MRPSHFTMKTRSNLACTAATIAIDHSHGGGLSAEVIDFSISVNPLGPPIRAMEEYHAAAARIISYPEPYPVLFERLLAQAHGVAPANVIAGNGSTQLVYLIFRVLQPRNPFVVIPTFSEIANAAAACGTPAHPIALQETSGFTLEPSALEDALARGADAIFIGRPNSPTGTLIPEASACGLARRCASQGAWCIFDEAFIEFAGDASLARFAADNPLVLVLRSMTKIYATPGLRLGFAIAAEDTITRMRNAIEPWSVSVPADQVGRACLSAPPDYLEHTLRTVAAERSFLERQLNAHPHLRVFPSTANFLMVAVEGERQTSAFGAYLIDRGIAIRDLARLPGCRSGLYRIAVRLRPDNERLIEAAHGWRPSD
jgi:threonine-phosphate decarboxylase